MTKDVLPTPSTAGCLSPGARPLLSPAEARQVDRACDRFEAAWHAGPPPQPEDYLEAVAEPARSALLRQLLLLDWDYRRRAGEHPDADDYRARFPDDASVIEEVGHEMAEAVVTTGGREDGSEAASTDWSFVVSPCRAETGVGDTTSGKYELVKELGHGGIGVVFRGRDRHLGRDLAVKVLREAYRDKPGARRRFIAEARIGSQLQHPAIVPVYEQGWLEDRRPYFTMKLVEGHTLAALLRERADAGQDLPRFLGVFEQVCQAMAYAHARGVVHRDLKPANVMVGAFREVQVMDWGFAKQLRSEQDDSPSSDSSSIGPPESSFRNGANLSQSGVMMGTPAYMPPEQARGESALIGPRADVFALGAILCEILTGRPPYPGATPDEVWRRAADGDLGDAFARLAACGADESMQVLARSCLSAERDKRPADAGAVARELTSYLASAQERLRQAQLERAAAEARAQEAGAKAKAERRAWRLTLALAVALLCGGAVATWQAVVANRAKDSADKRLGQIERGINILSSIFENLDPMAEEAEGRPLRAILGDRLDRAAADLEGEAVGDPLVVARLQDRLGRTYLGLGRGAPAETLFEKAVATRRAHFGPNDALTLESRHNLGVAVEAAGRRQDAIRLLEEVRDGRERVLGPDDPDTLTTVYCLGVAHWFAGRPKEAIPLLEKAHDGRTRLLGQDDDLTLTTREKLAGAYLSAGRRDEAVALAEQVWAARVKALGDDHPKSIGAMSSLAYVYQGAYRMKEALALFENARDQIVPKLGDYHPMTLFILRNLGHVLRAYRKTPEAIALLEQVRERELIVHGGQHPSTLITLWELGAAYQSAGDLNRSLALFRLAAAGVEKRHFEQSFAHNILVSLAEVHESLKQFKEAEQVRRTALPVVERQRGADSTHYAEELIRIGALLLRQKKPADAEALLRQALAILERHPNRGEQLYAQSLLGAALADQGRYSDAEPLLLEAYQGMKDSGPGHTGGVTLTGRRPVDVLERLVQLYDDWKRPDEAAKWRNELAAQAEGAPAPGRPNDK